jgi:hypothetical protein
VRHAAQLPINSQLTSITTSIRAHSIPLKGIQIEQNHHQRAVMRRLLLRFDQNSTDYSRVAALLEIGAPLAL